MAYPYDNDYEAAALAKAYKKPILKTDRKLWKLALFTILTLGLYQIFFFLPFSFDLDKVAPKRDGTKTWNFLFAFILSFFTMSIVMTVWHYHIAKRVEEALKERNIDYEFSTGTWWGWFFFGSFILVGEFVYFHKLCTAMNLLCEDYNAKADAQ